MRIGFDRLAIAILVLLAPPGLGRICARGDSINSLHSTGEGLPTGVVDPNFTIISAPAGATLNSGGTTDTIPPVSSPAYAAPSAGTQWIGPNRDDSLQQPIGNYDFRTTFNLAGLDASTAMITGVVAVNNRLADIRLNGTSLGISGGSLGSLLNFTIKHGFSSGINVLDFIVTNDDTGGPTALMVSETGTASVPEPSTLAVFCLGTLALFGRRAMRSRSGRVS